MPALLAAAVVALEVTRVFLLQPLHQRGVAQGSIGLLVSLAWVLVAPGHYLSRFLMGFRTLADVIGAFDAWRVLLALLFPLYFIAFALLGAINRRVNRRLDARAERAAARHQPKPEAAPAPEPATSSQPPPARRPSRRRLLRVTKNAVVTGAAAAASYPLLVEPHRLVVTRRVFPVRGLPASLDGLRVVQVSDIHLGPWLSVGRVRRIVEQTNALAPDLVALTGDFIMRSADYIPQVALALAHLRARVGVVGVLGNHDWNEDGPGCARALENIGVRMIDNARLFLTPGRTLSDRDADGLCVAGVGDLWRDVQLYDRALGGLPDDLPRLLLSHNPDVAEEPAFTGPGYRVDLMLSGHTHGGQIFLPAIGAPVTMSRYGQKYARGLVQGPTCPVYVSRGLGMAMLPLRLGSTPEIAVIELAAK